MKSEQAPDPFQQEQVLFKKAQDYLKPGPAFRLVTYLYAERKLLVFFFAHFMATMIIWVHFALIKFRQQEESVPEGAPFYWWKRIAPPLEFGSMHAILFQMGLIPLTMSRFSIASLSESILDRFVPLSRMLRIHIHLGYTMVLIVYIAVIFFILFFGLLCGGGEQTFCENFKTEIMITGYIILFFLLVIAGTSYFRHRMPYEAFYWIHHLVFIMYAVVIIHTLDGKQRSGDKQRSQTFRWFSASLLYYVCDRAAMHINHRYIARLLTSSQVTGNNGSKMLVLKLRRPILFNFKPGQYAYLRLKDIDIHWHPFSIASAPTSSELDFYIEVFGENSWTGQLWQMLENISGDNAENVFVDIEIMGPYGTSLARTEDYSHGLAIGAGSGIVPVLSLLKQHVRKLMHLDPAAHFVALQEHQSRVRRAEAAKKRRKGSIANKIVGSCFSNGEKGAKLHRDVVKEDIRNSIQKHGALQGHNARGSMMQVKKAAFQATRSIYGVVLLAALPVYGISLIGLTISWNTISIDLYDGMVEALQIATIIFQIFFAGVAFFVWDACEFAAYTDVAICIISGIGNYFAYDAYNRNGVLTGAEIALYSLLVGYMTARSWGMVVRSRHRSWRNSVNNDSVSILERLEVVWVTRSASLVSNVLPDVDEIWGNLVSVWGEENAKAVCCVTVYVTDPDPAQIALLRRELCGTTLYKTGCIRVGRPDLGEIIENHTIEMILTRRNSYSVLAFCGSPELGATIHQCKINNDMVTNITGNKNHQMEYVSESYGGNKAQVKWKNIESHKAIGEDTASESSDEGISKRSRVIRKKTVYASNDVEGSFHFAPLDDESDGEDDMVRPLKRTIVSNGSKRAQKGKKRGKRNTSVTESGNDRPASPGKAKKRGSKAGGSIGPQSSYSHQTDNDGSMA